MKYMSQVDQKEFDAFSEQYGNLLQGSPWASIKSNWDSELVGVEDDNSNLIAAALVLKKPLAMGFSMFYLPRGPIGTNQETIGYLLKELKKSARKEKCIFIKFDPEILVRKWNVKEEKPEQPDTSYVDYFVNELGAKHKGYTTFIAETVQPRYTMGVDLRNDFEKGFDRSCKRGLKTADLYGVETETTYGYDPEVLEEFTRLMHCTEEKKNVRLRDKEYFERMLKTYGEKANIILGKANFDQARMDLEKKKAELDAKEKLTKKEKEEYNRIVKGLEKLDGLHGSPYVSGILNIDHGKTMEMLYMGNDPAYSFTKASRRVYTDAYSKAKDRGIEYADMSGVEGTLSDGLYVHKAGYGSMIKEYIGEFDLVVMPMMYSIVNPIYEKRKADQA